MQTLKSTRILFSVLFVTGCQMSPQDCQVGLDDTYNRAVALVTLDNLPTSFSLQTNLVGASLNPENNGLLVVKTAQTVFNSENCTDKTSSEFLTITTLGETSEPQTLGQIPVSYVEAGRGGFSSLDEVVVTPDTGSKYPLIEVTQTTLPADGDEAFRPGPPTTVVYCFRGDQYQTGAICE